jgi:nucleoside 2-deoxyribosyltransferase
VPHRDAGDVGTKKEEKENVFEKDIYAIDNARIIIAILDGVDVDSGTAVELGYSYTHNKKIFGLLTDKRRWKAGGARSDEHNIIGLNNMVWGVCNARGNIYGTLEALYQDVETYLANLATSD